MGTTSPGSEELHPILSEASEGRVPPWTEAGEPRRKHMARVAALMGEWAQERGLGAGEVARWRAAGFLHDALRDADPEGLRSELDPSLRGLMGKILHGPAAAVRLRAEGVADEELLHAITYHTIGSGGFRELGMALYAADFLEPGRERQEKWRRTLRRRAPTELDRVVREILLAKVRYQMEKGRPVHYETIAFWNRFAEGKGWASASEL